MDLTALKAEILSGPLSADLAALVAAGDHGGIVQVLGEKNIDGYAAITVASAMVWAAGGPMVGIEAAAHNAQMPVAIQASCRVILALFNGGSEQLLHLEDTRVRAAFAGWLQAGIISQDDHDALLASAATQVSRCDQLGWPVPNTDQIAEALRG